MELINLIVLNILGCGIILMISREEVQLLKNSAVIIAVVIFLYSMKICAKFSINNGGMQFETKPFMLLNLDIKYILGIDGISLCFIVLTTFVVLVAIVASLMINILSKEFIFILLFLELLLINFFCVLDLIYIYIYFEVVLIPLMYLIGIWGSRERRIRAFYYIFFYTLIGSLIMLTAIIYIYVKYHTTDLRILTISFYDWEGYILYIIFSIAFFIKMPIMPLHIWLIEAHVESSTIGSVMLAGIILKMAPYGYIRIIYKICLDAHYYFLELILVICLVSIVVSNMIQVQQIDIKKAVAYSSIGHMGICCIGLLAVDLDGIMGSIQMMISHGLVSTALFLWVGMLYMRVGTKDVIYIKGLFNSVPRFELIFIILTLLNLGIPFSLNFIAEISIMKSVFMINILLGCLVTCTMMFSTMSNLFVLIRTKGGSNNYRVINNEDMNIKELILMLLLIFLIIMWGFASGKLMLFLEPSIILILK